MTYELNIKETALSYLNMVQAKVNTTAVVRAVLKEGNPAQLALLAAEIFDRAGEDTKARNSALSTLRTQMSNAAKALELDEKPTVKQVEGSFALVWLEWPEQDEDRRALQAAFNAFRKNPGVEEESNLLEAMAAWRGVTVDRLIAEQQALIDNAQKTITNLKAVA